MSKKFDITKHKNYGKLFDSDKKNYFDVARFVKSRQKNAAVYLAALSGAAYACRNCKLGSDKQKRMYALL